MAKDNGPRISVNKLAEYMEAKGKRQRQILRDQKFPEFKGPYYSEAGDAIARYLASNMEDASILSAAIHVLSQKTSTKAGVIRRINSNIDALESFELMLDSFNLKGAEPELGEHKPDKLVMHGVEISVRPEIVLRGTGKGGQKLVGAMKIHFPKTYSLNTDAGGYVAAILQRYSEDKLTAVGELVGSQYCFVIDVGSRTVHPPVKSIATRLADVENDCQNIAAIWPTIKQDE